MDTFKEVKIEDLKTLNQSYNINGLDEKLIDISSKIIGYNIRKAYLNRVKMNIF